MSVLPNYLDSKPGDLIAVSEDDETLYFNGHLSLEETIGRVESEGLETCNLVDNKPSVRQIYGFWGYDDDNPDRPWLHPFAKDQELCFPITEVWLF